MPSKKTVTTKSPARKKTAPKAKNKAHKELPWAKHIICFWKQNDLGIFSRRPDRWIEYWRSHPGVEKVLVFEPPTSDVQLQNLLKLSTHLDPVSATEYQLQLQSITSKLLGRCNDSKITYATYYDKNDPKINPSNYARWVIQTVRQAGIENPLAVVWPACFVNESLIAALKPQQVLVDLVDDQRLFPGNANQALTITQQYQSMIQIADQLVSNSDGLIKSFEKEFKCKIEHLANSALPMLPIDLNNKYLSLIEKPKRYIVGYVGNMRDRIDTDNLVKAIKKHPEWDFWFVGQTHRSEFYKAAHTLKNARFFGTLNYQDSQAIMSFFDVGIVPFVESDLVKSMSPIKINDYHRQGNCFVILNSKQTSLFEKSLVDTLRKLDVD